MLLILSAILLGISLCADCFAVSLCSSVGLDRARIRERVGKVAAIFAVVQTGFFLAGWAVGMGFDVLLSGWFSHFATVSGIIGFLLLLYVGGSMVYEAWKGEETRLSLQGFWPVVLGGVATSIDALTVGISYGIDGFSWADIWPTAVSIAVFTALSVLVGMLFGAAIGTRFGRPARLVGGLILIALGVTMLF
jgi:putative Mn2+ efflux pump MntP